MFKTLYSQDKIKKVVDCSGDEKITEDFHQEATNINNIVERYARTGILPQGRQGQYIDVSNVPDFQQMQQHVIDITRKFEMLPAKIRNEFNNDVNEYVAFVSTATEDQIYEKGLVKKPVEEVPVVEEIPPE